jgi:3-deoxy-manno-octulosonate cytidylyltransferase (CMP-KDO synthetase)
LPGKPLADIAGWPMVEHVYRRVATARGVDAVIVATDDDRIAEAVRSFGGVVRMTSPSHKTGTDRIAEIVPDLDCEIVVNVQGDLPLVEPGKIEEVLRPLFADPTLEMSTLRKAITDASDLANPNVVKVVVNRVGDALYFSRSSIPFIRGSGTTYKHIGLYAYRCPFLLTLAALPQTPLEIAESLEQLRAVENGFRIHVVETCFESIEVDTPEDLARVRRHLAVIAQA